ncbi:hypothetical protein [Kitasatospora sp. NBC_01539]
MSGAGDYENAPEFDPDRHTGDSGHHAQVGGHHGDPTMDPRL